MFAMIAKALVGSVLGEGMSILKGWLEQRRKIDEIKTEAAAKIEEAKAQAELKRLTADVDWEAEMAKQAGSSWKDEFWTVTLAAPLILIFFPPTQGFIITGFDALRTVPEWYLIAVGTAIGAAFGTQQIIKAITSWKGK
jgi:hypothetical protein